MELKQVLFLLEIARIQYLQKLYGIKKIAKAANIPTEKAYPHSFRHLFAKEYMQVTGDISELADMLGHSKIDTTWRYTRISGEDKRRNIDSLIL